MHTHTGCICLAFLHCALSNVHPKRLPKKMRSCIGCIYLAFLQCAYLNVSSNHLPYMLQSYTGCICLTSYQFLSLSFYIVIVFTQVKNFKIFIHHYYPRYKWEKKERWTLNLSTTDVLVLPNLNWTLLWIKRKKGKWNYHWQPLYRHFLIIKKSILIAFIPGITFKCFSMCIYHSLIRGSVKISFLTQLLFIEFSGEWRSLIWHPSLFFLPTNNMCFF